MLIKKTTRPLGHHLTEREIQMATYTRTPNALNPILGHVLAEYWAAVDWEMIRQAELLGNPEARPEANTTLEGLGTSRADVVAQIADSAQKGVDVIAALAWSVFEIEDEEEKHDAAVAIFGDELEVLSFNAVDKYLLDLSLVLSDPLAPYNK